MSTTGAKMFSTAVEPGAAGAARTRTRARARSCGAAGASMPGVQIDESGRKIPNELV